MKQLRFVRICVATLATLVMVAALTGCEELLDPPSPAVQQPAAGSPPNGDPTPADTASVTVWVAGPLTVAAAKGSHADIEAVTVSVAGNDSNGDRQDPLATATLKRSAEGAWTGNLSGLTVDTPLTFTATATDDVGEVIFRGTHTATLTSGGAQITIRLAAVYDDADNRLPKVAGISISNVSTGVPANVSFTVHGAGSESLDYRFTAGTFVPASGSVTLTAGVGTITGAYQPPTVPGWYTVRLAVWNAQGNRVEADFQIRVRSSALTASLGPVVQGITGRRTPAGVLWAANVSAVGDDARITYAWTFTDSNKKSGTFSDAAANPTILTGSAQSTSGTLSVTVTDAGGLATTASLAVPAGAFPSHALTPKAAALIVNEIDYDQPGSSDSAEFIEILNPGTDAVDLSAYRFELVDGADDEPYRSYDGSGQLAGGGFLVIADKKVIADLPGGTLSIPLTGSGVTNGPDGVRIVATADGRVVDAVHYEGSVPGAGEGSPAPADSASASTSIGRCPSGFDSNDNGLDFRTMTPTPGAANTCA